MSLLLETASDIVEHVELTEVRLVSFSAQEVEEQEDSVGVRFSLAEAEENLDISFEFRYVSDGYSITAKHLTAWSFQGKYQLNAEALAEFIERVAFMAVYPYVRQTISDFAQKLSIPTPTLGLIKDGQVNLNIDTEKLAQSIKNMTLGS